MLSSGLLLLASNVILFAAKMAFVACLTLSCSIVFSIFDLIWIWLAPMMMLSIMDLLSAVVSWEERGLVDIFGEILFRLVLG